MIERDSSLDALEAVQMTHRPRCRGFHNCLSTLKDTTMVLLAFVGLVVLVQVLGGADFEGGGGLPLVGMSWRKYQAQRLANNYMQYLINDEGQLEKKVDTKDKKKKKKKLQVPFTAPDGCEATVVILRHCEKGNIREHCSYAGYERAAYLATIFGDKKEDRWPLPSFIYALTPGKRHNKSKKNYREIEMVRPLASKANVTVNADFDVHADHQLIRDIFGKLRTGDICGKIAVVSWKHSEIPHLAHKLGCGPNQGCPSDYPSKSFDQAWTIKFVYQQLMHSEFKSGWLPDHALWEIYGSVQPEGFDPLSFSKKAGDYVPGGTPFGARWRNPMYEVPERMVFKYSKTNKQIGQ